MGELLQKVIDLGAQSGEVVGPAMEVGDLLTEFTPEFLKGITPGRRGRQRPDLDGKVKMPPSVARPWRGYGRPAGWPIPGPSSLLRGQGDEDVRMGMDRPVILDDG